MAIFKFYSSSPTFIPGPDIILLQNTIISLESYVQFWLKFLTPRVKTQKPDWYNVVKYFLKVQFWKKYLI